MKERYAVTELRKQANRWAPPPPPVLLLHASPPLLFASPRLSSPLLLLPSPRSSAYRMTFGELEEDLYQNDLGYTRSPLSLLLFLLFLLLLLLPLLCHLLHQGQHRQGRDRRRHPGGAGRRADQGQDLFARFVIHYLHLFVQVRISQTLKKNMQKQAAVWGGASSIKGSDKRARQAVSGFASSVAFTPVQVGAGAIAILIAIAILMVIAIPP